MTLKPNFTLESLVALARDGLDFFRHAQHTVDDTDVASVFASAADLRAMLLRDLHGAGAIPDPAALPAWPLSDGGLSYASLRAHLGANDRGVLAAGLLVREHALLALLARAFREQNAIDVRRLVKAYHGILRRAPETWHRLAQQQAAA